MRFKPPRNKERAEGGKRETNVGIFSKKQELGSDLGYLYDPKTDLIPTQTR